MALQFDVGLRNARANAIMAFVGPAAVLKFRSGPAPGSLAVADQGDVLATMVLPAQWLTQADGGVVLKAGNWEDLLADATGTAGHFRIYNSNGITARIQGSVSVLAGNGDMKLDSISFNQGQDVTVISFALAEGNQ